MAVHREYVPLHGVDALRKRKEVHLEKVRVFFSNLAVPLIDCRSGVIQDPQGAERRFQLLGEPDLHLLRGFGQDCSYPRFSLVGKGMGSG